MGIFSKVASTGSSTDWRTTKKVWAKINSGWVAATGVFAKTISGWVKMWPGNAPSVRASDPINIRLGGYNGTVATSPQLFASTDAGTSGTFLKLWGNDGSFDGVTPITISNRRMLCSDNIDGQVERFTLTGNDTIDFATVSQATRDLAEGYYIFYQLRATNVDGVLEAYSPPIKVIKRKPALLSYTVFSETGGVLQGQSGFGSLDVIEINAQIRWGWWIKPGGYLGGTPLLRWWKNTSKSPGGTLLKSINIETGYDYVSQSVDPNYTSDTNTSNVLTIYNNYGVGLTPLQAGEYIVAELYLENSYTAHYASPVSYWGSTGSAPSLTSVSLRTYDGQVDTVMDNQSDPRIVSQAYFEIVAQVADYESGTTFNFEPRIYKADTGVYLNYDSGATASNGFPVDVSPYSVSQSGTTATVIWRTYINSNFLTGSPTYGGGQAKYWFEFRLSATKPGGSPSYYTGSVFSNHGNSTLIPTYLYGSSGGAIYIHSHTQSVLSANNYNPGNAPQTVRFSITGDSYPSGYASYPRSYGIDFGDGVIENIEWPTGTNNPSYTTWDHTYTTNGTYTARLITVPQGFTTIGTRQRTITVGDVPASPTFLTATTNRTDGVNLTFGGSSNATGYNIFWNTAENGTPINNVTQGDFLNKSSPFLDTTIAAGVTRWYWVQARNANSDGYSTGVSPWYPVGNGVVGTRLTSYTVTWNGNGGTVGTEGSPWTFNAGGSVTVPSVTRSGYTFVRWTDTPSGDYTYTTTGGTFSPPSQNITMYARWTAVTTPTITSLTASAPSTASTQLVTVTVNWSSTNQASYFLNVLQTQVANYLDYGTTETSSNTSDSGSNFNVYSGASVTITLTVYSGANQTGTSATQSITYTPPIDVPSYTVTWNGNGGTVGTEGSPWTFNAGGSVTVPSVTRSGYTFVRWTDTPSGDYTYTTTGGTFSPPSQNITMYARWTVAQNITYGNCEYYSQDSTYECSSIYNRSVTTNYYRRQILVNGVWNGSYDTSGCTNTVSYGSYVLTDGRCGYTAPAAQWYCTTNYTNNQLPDEQYPSSTDQTGYVCGSYNTVCSYNNTGTYPSAPLAPACATCGACQDYGSATLVSSNNTRCSGTYYQYYDSYSIGQRKTCSDGSYEYCSNRSYDVTTSSSQISGLCGYSPTTTWYCTTSYQGGGTGNCGYNEYTYNASSSGTGYSTQCSTSGYPSCQSTNPAPTCISYKYNCKYYDVYDPASNNYFQCYGIGDCTANNNSDGSRTTCCAQYS